MNDEILVKGQDGKWYILRGEELLPYGKDELGIRNQELGVVDLPKGVSQEEYEKMEKAKPQIQPAQITQRSSVKSVLPTSVVQKSVVPVSHEEHPLRVELEEVIDRVIENVKAELRVAPAAEAQLFGGDSLLQKRFRTIVSSRLRDVRDTLETREMLNRNKRIGGLEISELDVIRVMKIIEKAFGEFQGKWKALEAKRIEEWKKKQAEDAGRRDEESRKKEEQELEERYSRLTGGIYKSQLPISKQIPIPKEIPKPKVEIPKKEPQVNAVKNIVRDQVTAAGATRDQVTTMKTVLPPATPSSTTSYILRSTPSSKVTDVRMAPKFVGPIEELAILTLEDFRRLAGTSQERAQKIVSKIEFLQKESIVRRAQGIEAWRKSPLNQ
ncbi:hypothetical protein A3H11_00215 [Candidatus Uhrbacteria bacterium RIFCSPLOWO2_12_FULL_47_10]|nr:MAG: hypothetical protein A3H11_00215 [Candidatus Uhrbacteria bacterium RIFCSPLOWO2_12_FULL_47_10]